MTLECDSLRREFDALRPVAPLSREGDGKPSPLREEMADVVAVHAPVAVPAALTVVYFMVHEEALLVTTVASTFGVQEPEPELPVVEVERSPSADGAVTRRHPRCVRWVDDETGVASQKARVVELIDSSSPPPVPTRYSVSLVASVAGEGISGRHACDPGFITLDRGRRQKGCGGRH